MPTTGFTLTTEPLPGNTQFMDLMEGIGVRVADFAPVYDAMYAAFRKIEAAKFDKEGPGWQELATSTVASRGSAHPILKVSGKLRRSFTTKGAPGAVVEPSPDGIFFGSDMLIAKVHQSGTDRAGKGNHTVIPARPIVDATEADAEMFSEILSKYVFGLGLGVTGATSVDTDAADAVEVGL